eukprot:7663124-Alexandrium_andersonii.AAC.1
MLDQLGASLVKAQESQFRHAALGLQLLGPYEASQRPSHAKVGALAQTPLATHLGNMRATAARARGVHTGPLRSAWATLCT